MRTVWAGLAPAQAAKADFIVRRDGEYLLKSTAGMDLAYLEDWAARLGVVAQLRELIG